MGVGSSALDLRPPRAIKRGDNGAGQTTHYNYDATGRIVSVSNPAGQTYQFEYDSDGRCVSEKNPLGVVTRRTYNALDHVTKVIAADGPSRPTNTQRRACSQK